MPQKPCPAAPTLGEAEAAGNTSDVNVEQHLVGDPAGGDSLPEDPVPDDHLPNHPLPVLPLPDVLLPDVPLPDVSLREAPPDCFAGLE